MFAELVELGKRVRKYPDALASCQCDFDIIIDTEGIFQILSNIQLELVSEYIPTTAKKGKARFLLDNADYTLGFEGSSDYAKNHEEYLKKLNEYKGISALSPIISFYSKPQEVEKALNAYKALSKSKQKGNLTFMIIDDVVGDGVRPISLDCVQEAIINKYSGEVNRNKENAVCSVCGKTDYPVVDKPHGGIKLPGSDKKCSLVSYNTNAFESYNLKGNLNSGICSSCARNYFEALSYLTEFEWVTTEKRQKIKKYRNARELSDDTLVVFWTKNPDEDIDPFSDVCQPSEERVRKLFSSIAIGDVQRAYREVDNYFYSCTLSSADARIAVRDWMAISISQYQKNIMQWYKDIETIKDGKLYYPGIYTIINNCIKKKAQPTKSDFKAKARIGTILWHAAIANTSLPIMILEGVLKQIEHGYFSEEKSTVIRLVLNRNINNNYKMKEVLDEQNESKAYLCGRLFALVCKLQFKAQGTVNSSIKDRFFASASNMPGMVMGLLLTKYVPIYEKKTRGAYTKSITEIAARIGHFPNMFSTMERGEFALGYYYQYNAKQNDNIND